ncbi:MAG: GTP cyclohydrolase-2 [Candidatus Xenobia bacterium]
MSIPRLEKLVSTRLPIEEGQFRLSLYRSGLNGCDHLMLVHGEVRGQQGVLTRIHSECFTGDVLGSLRCDCGAQLEASLQLIARAGRGVLLYLRQEGRGIGLADKLRAYNLQDQGFDTVDANAELGHEPDARDYTDAVLMLRDLGVESVDLITNNPTKIEALEGMGLRVRARVPTTLAVNPENRAYLDTKAQRMNHLLQLAPESAAPLEELEGWLNAHPIPADRPHVTVTYAQSLDGSIAEQRALSGYESQLMTHRLRGWHDGSLVGIGTVLSDDPRPTASTLIVADSQLRLPLQARLWSNPGGLMVAGAVGADPERRRALQELGATVLELPRNGGYGVDLASLLRTLHQRGIRRLMVEGGARVLNAFLRERLADAAVVTIAPRWAGGPGCVSPSVNRPLPQLVEPVWHKLGQDMVVWASLA